MQNIYKAWKSTLLAVMLLALLALLIWFGKLPEEATVAALALLMPVFTDWLKERKDE
jgi:cyanate permease